MDKLSNIKKIKGAGLGLRFSHFEDILSSSPPIEWFEVLVDNFLSPGPHHDKLHAIREKYPIVFHSIGMNLGGTDPLNKKYLKTLRNLKETFQAIQLSDHICWSAYDKHQHHDLLPIPYSKENATHVADRIKEVQDFMGEAIAVENISSYIEYKSSNISEWEFVSEVVEKADCQLLLDINNLWINATNLNYSLKEYMEKIPADRIAYMHLAGGEPEADLILDTHGASIQREVWDAFKEFIQKHGKKPSIIERDKNIPKFSELLEEFYYLKDILSGPS